MRKEIIVTLSMIVFMVAITMIVLAYTIVIADIRGSVRASSGPIVEVKPCMVNLGTLNPGQIISKTYTCIDALDVRGSVSMDISVNATPNVESMFGNRIFKYFNIVIYIVDSNGKIVCKTNCSAVGIIGMCSPMFCDLSPGLYTIKLIIHAAVNNYITKTQPFDVKIIADVSQSLFSEASKK